MLPDYNNNEISHRQSTIRSQPRGLLSRTTAETPRRGACRTRARAAHRVIRDVGREVRAGRCDEVHHRRDRGRLGAKPMMRKRSAEPATLRKRGGTERGGAKPGRTANTGNR
jgi:hypothetical protein